MRQGRYLSSLAAVLAAGVPMMASAQSDPFLGPSIGVFYPSNSTLRDVMGDAWFSFGVSRVKIDPYQKQNVGFDWNGFSKERSGSKVFMLAGTVGYTMPFAKPGDKMRPYFAIRGGLSYIDYAVDKAVNNRVSGKKLGFNANAELGVNIGERLNLSLRYDAFPSYEGLGFSGLSLALKWGLARF